MHNFILAIFIIAYYFQANITGFLGINSKITIYLLLSMCMIYVLFIKHDKSKLSAALYILLGSIAMLIYRYKEQMFSGSFISTCILVIPAFIIYILPNDWKTSSNIRLKDTLRKFLYNFYILECCIAILEFIMHRWIFGYSESSYGDGVWHFTSNSSDFRSVAICGSPLSNSLIVVTIGSFILYSSLSIKKRIGCYLLGLIAVFAFNSRTSIVLFFLSGFLFAIKGIFSKKNKNRWVYLGVIILSVILILFILLFTTMGSRLSATTDVEDDSSIMVRLKLFEYFSSASLNDYLWGASTVGLENEMEQIGVKVIENFWILFMMLFGLIPLLYFTFFYFKLARKLIEGYPLYDKIVLSVLFLVNASINNSLSSSYTPLLTFLLCIVLFQGSSKPDKESTFSSNVISHLS